MNMEGVEILKERAIQFWKNAKSLIRSGFFDLAAFNLEQFCQLYLKYKLTLLLGDFPKTHSIRKLLLELGKVRKRKEVEKFLTSNAVVIGNLESAYITSRYLPRRFVAEEVKQMLSFSKKFKEFMDKL